MCFGDLHRRLIPLRGCFAKAASADDAETQGSQGQRYYCRNGRSTFQSPPPEIPCSICSTGWNGSLLFGTTQRLCSRPAILPARSVPSLLRYTSCLSPGGHLRRHASAGECRCAPHGRFYVLLFLSHLSSFLLNDITYLAEQCLLTFTLIVSQML